MATERSSTPTDERRAVPAAERYAVELTGDPADIPRVRQDLREMAVRTGFAGRASDLVLMLDELVANALEHGGPPITVRAWHDGRLIMTVSDTGGGFDQRSVLRTHPPAMLGKRGRGLWIVRQVADHVEIDSTPQGTTVRIEFTHEPHIGA